MIYYNNYNDYINEYWFSLLLINIFFYLYLLINLFLIFFLFDLKYFKTLNELKFFGNTYFIYISLLLILLSLDGIPPLLGFISKFLIFLNLISKKSFFLIFFFVFINIFVIYFYIQNLRFLISKNVPNKFIIKNNNVVFNNKLVFLINLFNFYNFFIIFYIEDVFIFFNYLSSNIFI